MFEILYTIVAFLVAISILIAIHEFGHFWVARKAGVKILRFSIGFGKPLWTKHFGKDNSEFVIASIPMGGYVKMLDEREGEVPETEAHRAFNNQSLKKRAAIVVAGPLFNFLLAIFAYWMVFVIGVEGFKPVVGEVTPETPAAMAGLKNGQEIVAIDNTPTPIWDVALETLLPAMVDRGSVSMRVIGDDGTEFETTLDLQDSTEQLEPGNMFDILGFKPWRPEIKAVVGVVLENSPAQLAGLKEDDEIILISEQPVANWNELVEIVSARPNEPLTMTIVRDGQQLAITARTEAIAEGDKTIGRLGIGPRVSRENTVTHSYGVITSMGKSLEKTWNNSLLTLKMLGKMIIGEVSIKNISGPLNIAVYASHSASAGPARFLDFLAIVSLSLGILNLLPVPVLDGGHLMFYIVEAIKGRPVSEQTEIIAQQVGIALLVILMSMALYNDLVRLLN